MRPSDWHERFRLQAQWTADLRRYLVKRTGLDSFNLITERILEIGCGTAAVTADFNSITRAGMYGIDINIGYLRLAGSHHPELNRAGADAFRLPFPDAAFDAVYCHYLLLWLRDPAAAIHEMIRVTRPGGWVMALAEPDYAARVDYPLALEPAGRAQAQALRAQGADPSIGRKLGAIFHTPGLVNIEVGVLGAQWNAAPGEAALQSEWDVLGSDLGGNIAPEDLQRWENIDRRAWQDGSRILYVPTFYAVGQVA